MDILLSIIQLGLLGSCIYGYKNKKESTKYIGIAASFCIFLTFDILDIIIAIFYFLFSVDQNYLISMKKGVNKGVNKVIEKTKTTINFFESKEANYFPDIYQMTEQASNFENIINEMKVNTKTKISLKSCSNPNCANPFSGSLNCNECF